MTVKFTSQIVATSVVFSVYKFLQASSLISDIHFLFLIFANFDHLTCCPAKVIKNGPKYLL